ncbi:proline-rich transmembrane protein 1-like [Ptychodera flava]|uniref:proline-rich transmembrane protein 1-like n=1 Tax=Ptychodera flava TaxID=63121 RepID=UPI00396A6708
MTEKNQVSPEKQGMPPPYVAIPDSVVTTQPTLLGVPRMLVNPRDVPKDYLGFALFTTICCFWPVGLFAVLKARNVHRAVWQGDMYTAKRSSLWAKRLSIIALILGLVCLAVFIGWKVTVACMCREDGDYGDDDNPFRWMCGGGRDDDDRRHHHGHRGYD